MSSRLRKPWTTYFDPMPHPYSNGMWRVKEQNDAQTPIAILPEPQGGKRDEDGRATYNKRNAMLIAAAPDLLNITLTYLAKLKRQKQWTGTIAQIARIETILKNIEQ